MGALELNLQDLAAQTLEGMKRAGFEHAQVTAVHGKLDELGIAHNEPSLLRSTESHKLMLLGIAGGRMASTELSQVDREAVQARIASLYKDAQSAPQDEANAVSSGQHARIVQGPQQGDRELLAAKVKELLAFRAGETPRMMLEEGSCSHQWQRWHTLTTGGSDLAASIGCYSLSAIGAAREGSKSSSYNFTGGSADELASQPAQAYFGLADMMRESERQIDTQPIGGKFLGDVVFTPGAVSDLLGWFLGQLGDTQLISGSSLYQGSVGEVIASPLLTIRSRFDAPGVAAISGDAFAAPPVTLLEQGTLRALTPTLYGSRKTGLKHVPVAGGWDVVAGRTPLSEVIGGVQRGAIVGRLSMGNPAANGNFSGVIKNSFRIDGGAIGPALSETMIAGNMAQMLKDVVAISREQIDGGAQRLPWIRIANLHFS
ncbi:metallopeptidase TldD-related protein [Ramlibacter sp. PS4R-6]|uniref:metallopeptidase TldD-related protein n=1 Tax=Ramlibacter sp. PS4R-6 TaxID=3133438 RepID=UPI0030AC4380